MSNMELPASAPLWFFLGGRDLEMETIRNLLEAEAPGRFSDNGLCWGAKASDYAEDILRRRAMGFRPVLIELEWDLGELPEDVVVVDHHASKAGMHMPGALRQVFTLLALPERRWSRRFALVAANDSGYIPALQAAGASAEEIDAIRAEDRRSQGVTEDQERQAEQAVSRRQVLGDGALIEVDLPHDRTSPVVDRLHPAIHGSEQPATLAVFSPAEVNVFGSGATVERLDAAFPGGWKGGALPLYGYWGRADGHHQREQIRSVLRAWLADRSRGD